MNQEAEFQALYHSLENPNQWMIRPFVILIATILIAVWSNLSYMYVFAGQLIVWLSLVDFFHVKNILRKHYGKRAYIQYALELGRKYVGWENFLSYKRDFKLNIDQLVYKSLLKAEISSNKKYQKHQIAASLSLSYLVNVIVGIILTFVMISSGLTGTSEATLAFLQFFGIISTLGAFFAFLTQYEPGVNNEFRLMREEQQVLTQHVLKYMDKPDYIEVLKEEFDAKNKRKTTT
jgi:ABC-type transport system involved in cytochrome bd biosynthesis fused ATPase/permease subunit